MNAELQTNELLTESVSIDAFAETEHDDQLESNSTNIVGLPVLTKDGVDLKSHIASVEQFYIKQALDLKQWSCSASCKVTWFATYYTRRKIEKTSIPTYCNVIKLTFLY